MKLTQEKQMSFEEWLKCYYAENYAEGEMVLDDDLPDATEDWIGSQDSEDIIELSKHYGLDMAKVFIRENSVDF